MKYKVAVVSHYPARNMRAEAYQRLRALGASRGQAERFISHYVAFGEPGSSPKGGLTYVVIVVDGFFFAGIAHCSPEDVYVPKVGYRLALRRALVAAGVGVCESSESPGCTIN